MIDPPSCFHASPTGSQGIKVPGFIYGSRRLGKLWKQASPGPECDFPIMFSHLYASRFSSKRSRMFVSSSTMRSVTLTLPSTWTFGIRCHAFPTFRGCRVIRAGKLVPLRLTAETLVLRNPHDADIDWFGPPLQLELPPVQMIHVQSGG